MSCFMMDERAISVLSNTLESVMNSGFNRFGFEAPESLHKALSDCRDHYGFYFSEKIFSRLYILNARAYSTRYKSEWNGCVPSKPEIHSIIQERQREEHHEKLFPWHYKFAKLLDCFIYQVSEDATRNDPLTLALIDFSSSYKSFLVFNTAEYASEPWGTI